MNRYRKPKERTLILARTRNNITSFQVQKPIPWASPRWVTKLTGWDNEDFRAAREQNLVRFKETATGGWVYDLDSIPERLLKTKP